MVGTARLCAVVLVMFSLGFILPSVVQECADSVGARKDGVVDVHKELCIRKEHVRWEGRLINTKKANTSGHCEELCVRDGGCSYYTHHGGLARCYIFASVKSEVVERHTQNFTSGNCVYLCTIPQRQDASFTSGFCHMENHTWYEGGGPAGGYASQLHYRSPDSSAACAGRAPTPDACAKRCLEHIDCVTFNWRGADMACHEFSKRGPKHNGSDGFGHVAGNCRKEGQENMQTPRRALRSSWVTWLLCAYSVTVTALLFVSAHQNVISKSAAPMPSVPVMPVTGTVRIPMRVPVPVPTAPLLVSLQTKTPKVLGNSRRENERHLIVSHYKENLTWLNTGWGADFSHSVYEMGRVPGVVPDFSDSFVQDMGNGRYALLNFADEGSGYLRFILDNYDHLPDVMAFLHGKPQAHNPVISQWVGCLRDDVGDTPHFVFLTKRFVENRCIIDWEGNSMLKRIKIGPRAGEEIDYGAFVAYWKGFPWKLLNSTLDAPPTCVTFHCCAEFALTRAMVRSRPRSFYATLWAHMLDFILDEQNAKKYHGMQVRAAGGIFEHIWHMIFHEPVHMQRTTNSKYCAIMKPDCGACLDEIE